MTSLRVGEHEGIAVRLERLEHIHKEWTEGDKGCLRGGYYWRGGLAFERKMDFSPPNRKEVRTVVSVEQQMQKSLARGASSFSLDPKKTSYAESKGCTGCGGVVRSLFESFLMQPARGG